MLRDNSQQKMILVLDTLEQDSDSNVKMMTGQLLPMTGRCLGLPLGSRR